MGTVEQATENLGQRIRELEAAEFGLMLLGGADPNGVVDAGEGTLFWDSVNNNLYVNSDGVNAWQFSGGGGGIGGGGAANQVTYWTGALTIAGDAGFLYNAATDTITLAGGITLTGGAASVITVNDNVANALTIVDAGATEYMRIITTDAQPIVRFNDGGVDVDFYVEAVGVADALEIRGSDGRCTLGGAGTGVRATLANAEGLYVPWLAGDADATAYFGSTNASNDQNAIEAFTDSGMGVHASSTDYVGVYGTSATGIGVSGDATGNGTGGYFLSVTGTALAANLSGAGSAIAIFNDNGANVLIVQDGGQSDFAEYIRHLGDTDTYLRFRTNQITLVAGATETLDAGGVAGTWAFSGISGVTVEDGDYIGAGAGCSWLYDSSNGDITTTAKVGIGTTSPSYPLVVYSGASGATPPASADDLVVENNGAAGISILFPDANTGFLNFGTNTDGTGCRVLWDYPNTLMKVGTTSTGGEVVIDAGNNNEVIRVKTTGVGIFDSTPDAPLDVYHATTNIVAFFESGDDIGGIKVADNDTTAYVYAADNYLYLGGDAAKAATNVTIATGTGAIVTGGTIAATHGDNWALEDYHASAPTADGYVRVDINGTTYHLLAYAPP